MLKQNKIVLILEYMEGGDAFDYLCKHGRLSENLACKWFRSMVKGIEYLHANLIVHRDLKLENVLVGADNQIKITGDTLASSSCVHV
jgi:serine/threonine protein kinase